MKYLSIDVSPWLNEDGVVSSLYFGNQFEPAHEETTPYDQLIDRALESYTVRDVIRDKDYADADAFVKALEQASTYARAQLESMREE